MTVVCVARANRARAAAAAAAAAVQLLTPPLLCEYKCVCALEIINKLTTK